MIKILIQCIYNVENQSTSSFILKVFSKHVDV